MIKRRILAVMDRTQARKEQVMGLVMEGYDVTTVHSSPDAEESVRTGMYGLVLADMSSPNVDSLNFLAVFRDKNPIGRIIALSRRPDFNSALQSLKLSAYDYLFEPVTRGMIVGSVERAFKDSEKTMSRIRAQAAEENMRLRDELEKANVDTIMALANALEARDEYTRGHSFRVSELAVKVGEKMGLPQEDIKKLRYGGILHDIGKIGVDKKVLNKKTPLTKEDFDNIYQHTTVGVKIISSVESLKCVSPIINYHHEAYEHLHTMLDKDSRAFLLVCVIKVADAYDAMVSDRPYRKALPSEMAVTELRSYAGSEFHPGVVEELAKVVRAETVRTIGKSNEQKIYGRAGLALGFV